MTDHAPFDPERYQTEINKLRRENAALRQEINHGLLRGQEFVLRAMSVVPDILYVFDLIQKRDVWANREVTHVLGYTQEQIDAMAERLLEILLHPDDVLRYREHERHRIEIHDGEVIEFEYRMRNADGTWRWLRSREMIFARDTEGNPNQIVGAALDITTRKEAELALHASQERLKFALDAAYMIAFEWDIVKDEVRRTFSIEESLPKTPTTKPDTLEDVVRVVHIDDRGTFRARVRAALAHPEGLYEAEYRVSPAKGSVRWLFERGRVEFDANGRPLRLTGLSQDITARKLAEEALKESEALLSAVLDALPVGVIIADRTGKIVRENAAHRNLWGGSPHTTIWSELKERVGYWPPTGARIGIEEWAMSRTLQHGETVRAELVEYEHLNTKERRFYLNNSAPVRDNSGRIVAGVVVELDVTERKRIEDQLAEASRRKDEFLATLAHELRNPLAPIRNGLEILGRTTEASRQQKTREMMARQLSHMLRLIDDLLDVSRISSGKVTLRKQQISVQETVQIALEASAPLVQGARHSLDVTMPDHPIILLADPTRVAQVVTNLIANAAKYTPDQGHIFVSVEEIGTDVVIKVRDDGMGIPSEMLSQVFELFTQVNKTLDRAQGGLGIGLSLVKRLVEMHGGTVEVTSPGINQGSTFTVKIPLVAT